MTDDPKDPGKSEDFKTRATDFIDNVLDALHNPDPEYQARRAEFLEQKEREDAESLEKYHRERKATQAAKESAAAVEAERARVGPRGALTRDAFKRHLGWMNAGRQGAGRLDVRDANGRDMTLVGTLIKGGKLESVDFTGSDLSRSFWQDSEFTRCTFHRAQVSEIALEGATLVDCQFDDAKGTLINLKAAKLSGCSFNRVTFDKLRTRGAVSAHCSFVGAQLQNSKLQETTFLDCDFRGAALGRVEPMPSPSLEGALFERCDLRGADFDGADLTGAIFRSCKFGGAHGVPDASTSARVIDGDLSTDGDGSALGGLEALLQYLTASVARTPVTLDQPSTLIATWVDDEERVEPGVELVIYSVGPFGAQKVSSESVSPEDRLSTYAAVFSKGIRFGGNHINSEYIWVADDVGYAIWSPTEVVCHGNRSVLELSAGRVSVSQIVGVLSFADLEKKGDRGVRCRLKDGSYVSVVEQFDPPSEHPLVDYGNDLVFSMDSWWTRSLARDLANWLGVVHDDRVLSGTSNAIDLALNAFGRLIAERVETLPATGSFEPVELDYGTLGENPVTFVQAPDWLDDSCRTCQLKVWAPTRTTSAAQDLARGANKELAAQLRSVRFASDVIAALGALKRALGA